MPQPTAIWNTARDVWETPNTESLFCGHLAVFSETLPTSGMTRSGVAFALPTWEHRTEGSGYSSSPDDVTLLLTPVASEGTKPSNTMGVARRKTTGEVFLTNQIVSLCGLDPSEAQVMDLLPTPAASVMNDGEDVAHWDERRERIKAKGINGNGMGEPLTIAAQRLLPTPSANIGMNGGSQHPDKRRAGNHQPSIQDVAEHTLVSSCYDCDCQYGCRGIEAEATNWGPYEPAIRRWELALARPAPAPTEPNKNGNPRLSPKFTEWMMGVPEGWITGIPISRNEQLKACGNGVVPQQAAAALRDMFTVFEGAQP